MKKIFASLTGIVIPLFVFAQQVRPVPSSQIYREIAQLNRLVNVLYVAAHPDDENTRMLGWLVNDQYARTAYLSLTRGDGGQNILGSEQGAPLGLIRTYELLEARKLDGPEQYFTRANDFGYSKTLPETLQHWKEDLLTQDVTWVFRSFRPDVVICRFPPNAQAGHGQHAASAYIAEKAFQASGDRQRYPEQLQRVAPWQPKRILFNAFRFGDRNTFSDDQFKQKVGQYNPALGMGYGELAGISRSRHKSQGAGTPSTPGVQTENFSLTGGEPISTSLFDGIDITWNRVGRPDIGEKIGQILREYNFLRPDASLSALLALRPAIGTVKDDYWRTEKMRLLDQIILHCSGFLIETYTRQATAVAGANLPFSIRATVRAGIPVSIQQIEWPDGTREGLRAIPNDSLITWEQKVTIPASTPISEPFWLSSPAPDPDHYAIPDASIVHQAETPLRLFARVSLAIGDAVIEVPAPLSFKKLDPVKGDVVEPLRIVPDATLSFTEPLIVVTPGAKAQVAVRIHAEKDLENAALRISTDHSMSEVSGLNLRAATDTIIKMQINSQKTANDYHRIDAILSAGGKTYDKMQHVIQYDHIPTLQYFTPATAKLMHVNWKTSVRNIGYVEGAGDKTAQVLQLAGLNVETLKESDFSDVEKLKRFDAIITGVRAVNTEKRMNVWLPMLHEYVKRGGTLVMQYNTQQDLATTQFGPYPFKLSNTRVAEETAAVKMTQPAHRLLNYPNKISDTDFKDWVQERGLNFPAAGWDTRYETIFEMNDAGESPSAGSVLYAKYGQGHYVYTGLSLFRQLPAGKTGAIRLLMNMLSVGKG